MKMLFHKAIISKKEIYPIKGVKEDSCYKIIKLIELIVKLMIKKQKEF